MPQLTLKYCSIADVSTIESKKTDGKGNKMDKVVKINIDEEDFFDMLDSVNPKNLIKYLDIREIPHRDALNINVKPLVVDNLPDKGSPQFCRSIANIRVNEGRNTKKLNRLVRLIGRYDKINVAKE